MLLQCCVHGRNLLLWPYPDIRRVGVGSAGRRYPFPLDIWWSRTFFSAGLTGQGSFPWGERARGGQRAPVSRCPEVGWVAGTTASGTSPIFIWLAGIVPGLCHGRFAPCGSVSIYLRVKFLGGFFGFLPGQVLVVRRVLRGHFLAMLFSSSLRFHGGIREHHRVVVSSARTVRSSAVFPCQIRPIRWLEANRMYTGPCRNSSVWGFRRYRRDANLPMWRGPSFPIGS